MKEGFVYRWTDSTNGMYYIGCHKGNSGDGYIGSGTYFLKAYNKRPEAFSREVLYIGEHFAELEEFMLVELNASQDKQSYNLTNACRGQHEYTSEIKEKISKAHKGKVTSESTKKKMSLAAKGKKKSLAHRKALSEAVKGTCHAGHRLLDTTTNIEYQSLLNYCTKHNLNAPTVWNNLNGKTKKNKYKHLKHLNR